MSRTSTLDLLIVGAGPAGVAAAQQAFRDRLAAALVTATPPGGMLHAARTLTNLPGFDHPITGPTLAKRLLDSLRATGLPVITDRVIRIRPADGKRPVGFTAELAGGASFQATAVILATGTKPLPAPFPNWDTVQKAGLGHRDASTLPARLDGKSLAVLGGGDVAFDTALIGMDRGAKEVSILVRGPSPRAAPHLVAEANARGVSVHTNTQVEEVQLLSAGGDDAEDKRFRVHLSLASGNPMTVDMIALCIGREPADDLLTKDLAPSIRELPPGIWIAGDLATEAPGRFVLWALGSGQQAAVRAAAHIRT